MNKRTEALKKMIACAMFCAIAYVFSFIKFNLMFLSFDPKDSIISISSLFFGWQSGLGISLVTALIEIPTSGTGFYGFIMNFVSSAAMSVTVGLLYKYNRSIYGAIVSLLCGAAAMVVVMTLMNLLVTPYFMGVPVPEVARLLPTLFLPFNTIKGLFNAALTLVLYKPISSALYASGFFPPKERDNSYKGGYVLGKKSIIVTACGILVLALCIVVFIVVLKGTVGNEI